MTARQAMAFVKKHGIVLERARGAVPCLVDAIVGEEVRGSWWSHLESHHIFRVLGAVADSPGVLRCRLVNEKVTYAHRRVWPALVRLADGIGKHRLDRHDQEHTETGAHRIVTTPFSEMGAQSGDERSREARRERCAHHALPVQTLRLSSGPVQPSGDSGSIRARRGENLSHARLSVVPVPTSNREAMHLGPVGDLLTRIGLAIRIREACFPGLATDDAVDDEAALFLKGRARALGAGTIGAVAIELVPEPPHLGLPSPDGVTRDDRASRPNEVDPGPPVRWPLRGNDGIWDRLRCRAQCS